MDNCGQNKLVDEATTTTVATFSPHSMAVNQQQSVMEQGNTMAINQHRVAKQRQDSTACGRSIKLRKGSSTQQFQEQKHICGSLSSSSASSSGCSSVESPSSIESPSSSSSSSSSSSTSSSSSSTSSSQIPSTQKRAQNFNEFSAVQTSNCLTKTCRDNHHSTGPNGNEQDEGLEVNEALYLRRPLNIGGVGTTCSDINSSSGNGQVGGNDNDDHLINCCDCNVGSLRGTIIGAPKFATKLSENGGAEMSEFSAYTLQKSLTIGRRKISKNPLRPTILQHHNHQQQAATCDGSSKKNCCERVSHQQQQHQQNSTKAVKRSLTVKLTPSRTAAPSADYCCCCSGDCSLDLAALEQNNNLIKQPKQVLSNSSRTIDSGRNESERHKTLKINSLQAVKSSINVVTQFSMDNLGSEQKKKPAIINSALLRRATIVGRSPLKRAPIAGAPTTTTTDETTCHEHSTVACSHSKCIGRRGAAGRAKWEEVIQAKVALNRVQRPQTRRLLPVPPPVVPLYKEMALFGNEKVKEDKREGEEKEEEEIKLKEGREKFECDDSAFSSELENSNAMLTQLDNSTQLKPQLGNRNSTNNRVGFSNFVEQHRDNSGVINLCDKLQAEEFKKFHTTSSSSNLPENEFNTPSSLSAQSLLDINKLSRRDSGDEFDNKVNKYVEDDSIFDGRESNKHQRYYHENWQNLDSLNFNRQNSQQSQSQAASKNLKRIDKRMANSCIFISKTPPSPSNSSKFCQDNLAAKDASEALGDFCDIKIGSGNGGNFSSTIGRKTGRFLEKLRQSLITNFNRSTNGANSSLNNQQSDINSTKITNLNTETTYKQQQQPPPTTTTTLDNNYLNHTSKLDESNNMSKTKNNFGEDIQADVVYKDLLEKELNGCGEAIYDTPEYDGRECIGRPVGAFERKIARPVARPSMPPPPPPPPPLPTFAIPLSSEPPLKAAEASSSFEMRRSLHELNARACVVDERLGRRVDSNNKLIPLVKSLSIQSFDELDQVNNKFKLTIDRTSRNYRDCIEDNRQSNKTEKTNNNNNNKGEESSLTHEHFIRKDLYNEQIGLKTKQRCDSTQVKNNIEQYQEEKHEEEKEKQAVAKKERRDKEEGSNSLSLIARPSTATNKLLSSSSATATTKRRKAVQFADQNQTIPSLGEIFVGRQEQNYNINNNLETFDSEKVSFLEETNINKSLEGEQNWVRGHQLRKVTNLTRDKKKAINEIATKFNNCLAINYRAADHIETAKNPSAGGILLSRSVNFQESKAVTTDEEKHHLAAENRTGLRSCVKVSEAKMGSSQSVSIEVEGEGRRERIRERERIRGGEKGVCKSSKKATCKTINFVPTTLGVDNHVSKKANSSQNGASHSIKNPLKTLSSLTEKLTICETATAAATTAAAKLKTIPNSHLIAHKEAPASSVSESYSSSLSSSQVLQQQQQQQQQQHHQRQNVCSTTKSFKPAATAATTMSSSLTATITKVKGISKCGNANNSNITANNSLAATAPANQAQSMSKLAAAAATASTAVTGTTNLMSTRNLPLEDSLEKRRKSIQNGDVFIYPSLYKDLNECSKCSRDNKICNCTVERDENSDGDVDGNDSANDARRGTENDIEANTRLSELATSKSIPISTTTTTVATTTANMVTTTNTTKIETIPETNSTTTTTVTTREASGTKTSASPTIYTTIAPSSSNVDVSSSSSSSSLGGGGGSNALTLSNSNNFLQTTDYDSASNDIAVGETSTIDKNIIRDEVNEAKRNQRQEQQQPHYTTNKQLSLNQDRQLQQQQRTRFPASPIKSSQLSQKISQFEQKESSGSQFHDESPFWNNQQLKSVYKISIATASIDQKSNQLRLSSPKIIVPSNGLSSDHYQRSSQQQAPNSSSFASNSMSSFVSPLKINSKPTINSVTSICPPAVPPRVTLNSSNSNGGINNINRSSSIETINECSQENNTKKAASSQSLLNIIQNQHQNNQKQQQQQYQPPDYYRKTLSNSSCVLNTFTTSTCSQGEQIASTRLSSPITAIALNGATATLSSLDKTLSSDSVKKLDQKLLFVGPTISSISKLSPSLSSYTNNNVETNSNNSLYSSASSFFQPNNINNNSSSSPNKNNNLKSINNRTTVLNGDSTTNSQSLPVTTVEAKVTAISIGSPTRSPPSIDLEKILPPLLVTKCETDSDKQYNGKQCSNGKETCKIFIDSNNNTTNSNNNNNNVEQKNCINGESKEANSSSSYNQQQQLTCNLKIGDAIKISSTSICIGSTIQSLPITKVANSSNANDLQLTSIIPIEPLSSRRRTAINKLSRQAIHEDDDFDISTAASTTATTTTTNSTETTISTIITPSLPSLKSQSNLLSNLAIMEKESACGNVLVSDETSVNNDTLEYSPILTGVRDYIKNVNTELQVKTSTASSISGDELALVTSHSNESGSLVMNPLTLTDNINSNLNQANFVGKVHKAIELESPKKSIFDGASKDEILEYLEDARERVPEILMAADDVMVISENELIVVNQLDPGSPATPISIVESTEVIESKSLNPNSSVSSNSGNLGGAHSDKLRQHLQEMFQATQLSNSQFSSSKNETTDDEAGGCSSSDQKSVLVSHLGSSLDVTNNITQQSESQLESSRRICNDLKAFSRVTGETLDSIEDQIISNNESGLSDIQKLLVNDTRDNNLGNDSSKLYNGQQMSSIDGRFSRQSVRTTTSSLSNTSNASIGEVINNSSDYAPSTMYTGRRNSTSETSPNARARSSVLQMMMLQKRYSNRDSLSSPSSSPPSSVSPSSTSSNQTSGNCSAASTFYASSSLSSSSPLLALSSITATNSPSIIKNNSNNSNHNKSIKNSAPMTTTINQTNDSSIMTSHQPLSEVGIKSSRVDRDDSGLGTDLNHQDKKAQAQSLLGYPQLSNILNNQIVDNSARQQNNTNQLSSNVEISSMKLIDGEINGKLSVIDEIGQKQIPSSLSKKTAATTTATLPPTISANSNPSLVRFKPPTFASSANLMSKTSHGHYTTMSRLNYYFMNRHPSENNNSESTIDFQCLDCDQFLDVDHSTMLTKTNEIRLLRGNDSESLMNQSAANDGGNGGKPLTMDQLDRAYIAAMNGLPLCKTCEKKRIERKEIISEFVETELKYGRDLKIIHDEFYRPMRIAGLLSKDQINGVFLNLEELIIVHCKFADRLEAAISDAHLMGDIDYNTVNIGRLFVSSAEMLSAFESYCIRQGSAACLLARLAKEKELLRIFLRVSQMENTLLRRMNLAAFLMVPVQRVTKYPLLLNRLYKVTAYHHKDREALRDAQLKVELHLEHINQQTKGFGASNKIWRRISNLSAPISNRRGLINAEDIGYIKLRKTAMDMLKWDRDETQFIHSGRINFAPLNEYLTKQKMKSIRYMTAHALLVVLGKPNWKYRPDLVKANLDNKLMTPTPGGNGIKETALLLFREKNGRFLPCREPLFLSNCVLSNDCCQYNNECQIINQTNHHHHHHHHHNNGNNSKSNSNDSNSNNSNPNTNSSSNNNNNQRKVLTASAPIDCKESTNRQRTSSSDSNGNQSSIDLSSMNTKVYEVSGDAVSVTSLKSLPEDRNNSIALSSPPNVAHTSRSYSLASALPRTTITTNSSSLNLSKPTCTTTSSNMTILNHLMTKVNNYHNKSQSTTSNKVPLNEQQQQQPNKNSNTISSPPTIPVTTTAGTQLTASLSICSGMNQSVANLNNTQQSNSQQQQQQQQQQQNNQNTSVTDSSVYNNGRVILNNSSSCNSNSEIYQQYNHHYFHNHHQPYGDYEESFEIHERLSKESMLLRADTPLKTRYWLQMLRYHAKDLGQWRARRNGLANIMMMRQD